LDHMIPSSRGGAHTWTNLVTACKRCNAKKGDFTPEEAQMPLHLKPYKPSYSLFLRDGNTPRTDWDEYLGS
jgi:5-methylcytosine-specific restriction endonuclease McrA